MQKLYLNTFTDNIKSALKFFDSLSATEPIINIVSDYLDTIPKEELDTYLGNSDFAISFNNKELKIGIFHKLEDYTTSMVVIDDGISYRLNSSLKKLNTKYFNTGDLYCPTFFIQIGDITYDQFNRKLLEEMRGSSVTADPEQQ